MKISMQLFLGAALAAPVSVFAGVTRDANGWTQVTPSADSRVIYVSNAGSDSNNGLSEATAKATINGTNGANSLMRSGFPDHMLLRRGDTFTTGSLGAWKSGRSASEPVVISYYGTSGARPVIKITNYFIDHNGSVRNHIFLKGIEVYKSNSDPNSPDFTGASCTNAIRFIGGGANIRIEDCRFRFLEVSIHEYNAAGTDEAAASNRPCAHAQGYTRWVDRGVGFSFRSKRERRREAESPRLGQDVERPTPTSMRCCSTAAVSGARSSATRSSSMLTTSPTTRVRRR